MESEIDFPRMRTQGKEIKSVRKIKRLKENSKKNGVSEKTNVRYEESGFQRHKVISEGALGLGAVKSIGETSVILECLFGIQVKLSVMNMGELLYETLRNGDVFLDSLFHMGQMIAFKILKLPGERGVGKDKRVRKYAEVSSDPAVLNAHISCASLRNGVVLNGAVESVEDKGIIVRLFPSVEIKGFLPNDRLSPTLDKENLIRGQLLLVRVQHETLPKLGRTVNLSAVPEADWLTEEAMSNIQLNNIMPGTLLRVSPTNANDKGVAVEIGSGMKSFILKRYLPPRFQADPAKCLKPLRAVVMFRLPNSDSLFLSAHPDIVAVSKAFRRIDFKNHQIGDFLQCKVKMVDKEGNVTFDLLTNEGKSQLFTAFSTKKWLDDEAQYEIDAVHEVRVLLYRLIERELLVTTRKDILAQKMVSANDAKLGDKVVAKLTAIKQSGVFVKVYGTITGFIPKSHLSDKLITHIGKHFAVGETHKCRVLDVAVFHSRLILTMKPSLIKSKDAMIRCYEEAAVGMVSKGYVVNISPSGELVIGFYGKVRALMTVKDAKRLGNDVRLGLTVRVRVVKVEPNKQRMLVAPATASMEIEQPVKPFAHVTNDFLPAFFPASVRGNYGISQQHGEKLDIVVHLRSEWGGDLTAELPLGLFSDCLEQQFETLVDFVAQGSRCRVTVLGEVAGSIKVSSKRFLINWLENHARITSFEQLEKDQLVCGIVTKKHPKMGYFVELAGGSALVAHARFIHGENLSSTSSELQIGQTVICRVSSITVEKKRFSLILDANLCMPPELEPHALGIALVQSALDELNWLTISSRKDFVIPSIGSIVKFVVEDATEQRLYLSCADNNKLKGRARCGNFIINHQKKGDCVEGVILSICFPTCELDIYVLEKSKVCMGVENLDLAVTKIGQCNVKICLQKRDYLVGVAFTDVWSPLVVYIPTRSHPNIVVSEVDLVRYAREITSSPVSLRTVTGNVVIGVKEDIACKGGHKKETCSTYVREGRKAGGFSERNPLVPTSSTKSKPFKVYTARVVGRWKKGEISYGAVELSLPGSQLGRLHASEFQEDFLESRSNPVDAFLKIYEGKSVNVKVISISTVKEHGVKIGRQIKTVVHRVAECTMRRAKMAETKKKQSLLGYPQNYAPGSMIPVFVTKGPHVGVVKVEISPLWNGVIHKQNLGDEYLMLNPTNGKSALIDYDFIPGEKLSAKVIGLGNVKKGRTRSRHRKCLELTLVDRKKTFGLMDKVRARVISVVERPLRVILELSNAQRAVLTTTGITNSFSEAVSAMQAFELNELYQLYLIQFDEEKGHWIAVTEARLESTEKEKMGNKLYMTTKDIQIGMVIEAFIVSETSSGTLYAEISPVLIARVETDKNTTDLQLGDLIKAQVSSVLTDEKLKVVYIETLQRNDVAKENYQNKRKRVRRTSATSDSSTDVKKKRLRATCCLTSSIGDKFQENFAGENEVVAKIDWSIKDQLTAKFAAVATFEKHESLATGKNGEVGNARISGDNRQKAEKGKEMEIEQMKTLTKCEGRLFSSGCKPDSDADYELLTTSNPNSSAVWIRYMSFFLEQNDLQKARAVAERALSAIDFREEGEIFNVWNAYLILEVVYGNLETLDAVFKRAAMNTDALNMFKQLFKIYKRMDNLARADTVLDEMLKRFRLTDIDVWFLAAQHYLETGRAEEFRKILKKATESLPTSSHVMVFSRFAQLEYKYGDIEQGKTIFENILNSFPKKTDVWTVYIDLTIKCGKPDEARALFERVTALQLTAYKMRLFFKKWLEFEENFGDAEHLKAVKQRAIHYVEKITDCMSSQIDNES